MSLDAIYANIAAARLELSEIRDPPMQVRDAIKRLSDAISLAQGTEAQRATTVEQGVVHDGPVAKPCAETPGGEGK